MTSMKMTSSSLIQNAAFSLLLAASMTSLPAASTMFDTDYQAGSYQWAPLKVYHFGGTQQTDSFRDLTWWTHGDQEPANYYAVWQSPSFTSPGGVTLAGHAGTSIGSYIKWGIMGTGTMPSGALLGPIQAGTVTQALLDANPITPKAIDESRVFSISSSTPLDGLTGLVFQLRTGTIFPASPDFTPFELAQMAAPVVLSLNGGSIFLNWDSRELTHLSQDSFSANYTQEVWEFRWDLSGIEEPITDFSIAWDSHPFGNVFGAQLDQIAVPEPSAAALAAAGLGLCLRRVRRKA